jgi:predicted molibdopterin-dependent oxidoreductase YjgC
VGRRWLGLDVGTDIALANAWPARSSWPASRTESFIERHHGLRGLPRRVEPWTLERGEAVTGVPPPLIRELAHDYARADRAMICWTLGITEHHNAVDNVLSLINLGAAHRPRRALGLGLNPLRGQNNVQGGGDMGALPHKLPGFQDVEKTRTRARTSSAAWGVPSRRSYGLAPHRDVRGDGAAASCARST